MNSYSKYMKQIKLSILDDLIEYLNPRAKGEGFVEILYNTAISFEAKKGKTERVNLGEGWIAESLMLTQSLSLQSSDNSMSILFVSGGGIRLDHESGEFEYVKSGDQIEIKRKSLCIVHPVTGYGNTTIVCISDARGLLSEADPVTSNEVTVEPPYYWGYDRRYAQTYEEGGLTWETMDPNESTVSIVGDLILDKQNDAIIDLGCGEGRDTIWLASQGYNVTGVDVSSSALDKARRLACERGLTPNLIERDVIFLRNIPNDSFSVALNMGCLHMLDSETDRRGHLKRVFEILKPGGTLIVNHCKKDWLKGFWSIVDFNSVKSCKPGDFIPRKIRIADNKIKMINMEVLHHKVMNSSDLFDELSSIGFTNIRVLEENQFTFGNSAILICRKPVT